MQLTIYTVETNCIYAQQHTLCVTLYDDPTWPTEDILVQKYVYVLENVWQMCITV